jgi:hypothetical protein
MLPWKEIARGLLEVQNVSKCILPRLAPATSALGLDLPCNHAVTSSIARRCHSSSVGCSTGGQAQASAKDPCPVMVSSRPSMTWGWAASRPLQPFGSHYGNQLHRRAATSAGGGSAAAAAAAAAAGAAPPIVSNTASQQQQQRTASHLMQVQAHIDDNDSDDAEEAGAYRADPAHPAYTQQQQQQQQQQPAPPGVARHAGPHVVRDSPDSHMWQQVPTALHQQQQQQLQHQQQQQSLAVKAYYLGECCGCPPPLGHELLQQQAPLWTEGACPSGSTTTMRDEEPAPRACTMHTSFSTALAQPSVSSPPHRHTSCSRA